MRVLVCGGRDFTDSDFLNRVLDTLAKEIVIDCVIEGNARGADRMAGFWARKNKILNLKFNANWALHGNSAGIIRNKQMLDEGKPDIVIVFAGGRGTANMIAQSEKAGVIVKKMFTEL